MTFESNTEFKIVENEAEPSIKVLVNSADDINSVSSTRYCLLLLPFNATYSKTLGTVYN